MNMDLPLQTTIHVEENTILKRLDFKLIITIFALNLLGLFILFSATHGPLSRDIAPLFVSQIFWLIIGWTVFFAITLIDYGIFYRLAYAIYFLNLGALAVTNIFGTVALGARRWVDLGFFRYQPSETMKLAVIILLARFLCHRNTSGQGMGIRDLALPLLILGVPFLLVVEQPDLGTALLILAIGGTMLAFVKIRKKIIISSIVLAMLGAYAAWNYKLRDYQKNRILTFLSPTNDPRGTGYNSIQSKIAVGSGKFVGKGFRKGTQSQLEFLPERHTDFIYSVLSEEFGFVGSILTIGLFIMLFHVGITIASHSRDKFGALLTVGILAYVFWHMFINIGMVIGLLPIVGVPLPLLSYGGSSMLTTMAGLGLISSIAFRRYLF